MRRNVIVDLDAGSDDALALILLLSAEEESGFNVIGCTCTHGNTKVDYVCMNVLRTLETVNRQDVPVFKGAESSLLNLKEDPSATTYWHGHDGFGDNYFPPPKMQLQKENAIVALNRLASENVDCALICLGPLTNIALTLKTYPEFSQNIKEIYIMGGNINGIGNTTSSAEMNFYKDPEAAHIVLSTAECPITLLPWETCLDPDITTEWRFDVLGQSTSPQIYLLNAVETKLYKSQTKWNPCDAFLAAAFIDEAIITRSRYRHLSVELFGQHTRGQAIVDHTGKLEPNVKIIKGLDFELFKNMVLKVASYRPESHQLNAQ